MRRSRLSRPRAWFRRVACAPALPAGFVAGLLVAAAAAADGQPAPPRCDGRGRAAVPVAYAVTPVAPGGRLTHLAVTLRFCGDADGETRLALPAEWAGTAGLWRQLSAPAVDGARGVARDGDAAWRLTHAPRAPLTVRYAVLPNARDSADPGAGFEKARPVVRPGWFFFHGEGVFATPDGRDRAPARFAWGPLPAGWRVASDLDHLGAGRAGRVADATVTDATVTDVVESVALGAPDLRVVTRRVAGAPVRVAVRGPFAWAPDSLAAVVAAVVRAEHGYWGERPAPFLVAVAPLAPAPGGGTDVHGTGRTDGFSIAATSTVDVPAERRFLAHELMHRWVPGALGGLPAADEARDYWLGEGFTDFLAARTLLRAGLWTPAQFADELNAVLKRAATSPALPNAEVARRVWQDRDVQQLPYDRGHLLAHRLDHAFRTRTGGRRGLDAVLRAQRATAGRHAARGDTATAAALFPPAARAVTGVDVRPALAAHVGRGELVALDSATFGGCARVERVAGPVFERGWDARATQAAGGVAAGVDSLGAAWAAGLRDGMRIVRREAGVPGDPATRYVLRVSDGAREWTLDYLPAARLPATWQRVRLAEGAPARACAARLGGRRAGPALSGSYRGPTFRRVRPVDTFGPMPAPRPSRPALAAAALALLTGAHAGWAQGAPSVPPTAAAAPARPAPAEPDVRFMRQMIGHHAQALVMAALVPARSARADVRLVAERIAASQGDEIALMRRWLTVRGVPAPADSGGAGGVAGAEHMGHAAAGHSMAAPAAMPGMLTAEEVARLATLRGAAFDRAFLTGMIRHHEGALAMVAALFAAPGAAQDAEAFRLASDVDADQRAEVARMRRTLGALGTSR